MSEAPSPFGVNVVEVDGLTAVIDGGAVSTTIEPVAVAVPFCQLSTPRSVQVYVPSATGVPPTRPSHVATTSAPEPVCEPTTEPPASLTSNVQLTDSDTRTSTD